LALGLRDWRTHPPTKAIPMQDQPLILIGNPAFMLDRQRAQLTSPTGTDAITASSWRQQRGVCVCDVSGHRALRWWSMRQITCAALTLRSTLPRIFRHSQQVAEFRIWPQAVRSDRSIRPASSGRFRSLCDSRCCL
jgi:hypothetical protein